MIYANALDAPSETELVFVPSGKLLALVRMDGVEGERLGDAGVVARKHLQGSGKKRTALVELGGALDGGPLTVEEWGELPSAGDTSYAGIATRADGRALVSWYSGDLAKDDVWLLGMIAPTQIWTGSSMSRSGRDAWPDFDAVRPARDVISEPLPLIVRATMKLVARFASAALAIQLVHCAGSSEGGSAESAPDARPAAPVPPGASSPSEHDAAPAPSTDGSVAPAPSDPAKDGPYAIKEIDATTHVPSTKDDVPVHCAFPVSGPTSGPFPVVVLAHGFQLSASQYAGYLKRLATHGYVALTADYPAGFTSKSNIKDAQNLSGGLDWALSAPELAGKVDATKAGVMGHSRGGKDAVLAAVRDARFKAVLGLDPVDAKSPLGCDEKTECPDASEAVATLSIPTAFLGETTDATGGTLGQACAPAADNFTTFYAKAKAKSLAVTIAGANHMSFLDAPDDCGLTCSVCNEATAPHADVIGLAYAMTVAFFERNLRGIAAEDAYLKGPQAQSRYVAKGLATIQSK